MSDVNANLAQDVVKQVTERARDMAKQIATNIGQPVDSSKLKRDEVIRLWNLANPQADPAQVQQLIDAGQHSKALDMAYPWRNQLLGSGSPQVRADRAARFAKLAAEQEGPPQ